MHAAAVSVVIKVFAKRNGGGRGRRGDPLGEGRGQPVYSDKRVDRTVKKCVKCLYHLWRVYIIYWQAAVVRRLRAPFHICK